MGRCGCEGGTCDCLIVADDDATTTVTGLGTVDSPYIITSNTQTHLVTADTPTVDMHRTGDGSLSTPYVLSADVLAGVGDLSDVSLAGSVPVGNVLAWNGTAWVNAPASSAPVGAVSVGECLAGDGSVGDPLALLLDPDGGISCGTDGLTTVPDFITWDHNWHSEEGTLHYGSSDILAEYARWGQLCFLRFQWSSADGFTGGNGPWHWTAPFPIGLPTGQTIAGRVRTQNNRTYLGAAVITTDSTDITFLAPLDKDSSNVSAVQQQGPVGSGGVGSGVPLVGGDYSFDDTATSRLSWQGWYRVKAGF